MLTREIIARIEQKFGGTIRYPKDCESLSIAIKQACKKHISPSTLKRLWGFVKKVEQPRRYTLDVLANYIGFKDWETCLNYSRSQDNSSFFTVDGIETKKLNKGNRIEFTYEPGRHVVLEYKGSEKFKVISSKSSKLQTGDIIQFSYMALNHPLIASEVLRNKQSLGKFTAGKINGVSSIKIIE